MEVELEKILYEVAGVLILLLLAIVGFLFKKWMDGIDKKFDVLFLKVVKVEEKFDTNFANTRQYQFNLANDIKSIALERKVANGRTGKLKEKMTAQLNLCAERNDHHER